MKIRVEIDCTPVEARAFFGLPDVGPLNEAVVKELQGQMEKALATVGPEALLKMWMPIGAQGLEQFQKFVFGALRGAAGESAPAAPRDEPGKGRKG